MFHRQPVFAVAATSRDAARRAVAARPRSRSMRETPNVTVEQGSAAGETRAAGLRLRSTATPPRRLPRRRCAAPESSASAGQEHFYLEGQVALAVPGEDGAVLVYSSTQHPSEVQHIVARVLGAAGFVRDLPRAPHGRRLRRQGNASDAMGGDRGLGRAHDRPALQAAARPRRRHDDDRQAPRLRASTTPSATTPTAASARSISISTRAAAARPTVSIGVVDRAMFHADNAYFLPNSRIDSRRIKTNTVSNTAFRGFGGPQGMLAIERVIDAVAWALGRDPLDVRKANLYGPGRDVTPYGQTVEDRDVAPRLIEQLERSSDYRRAAQRDRGVQRALAGAQARHRADAGEVRHLLHAHASQPGRRAGARLSGRLRASQSRRHGDGPGPVPEGGAGGGGRVRHRARARAHHRHLDRQGAEHLGHRRFVRHRPERHGGAAGRARKSRRG